MDLFGKSRFPFQAYSAAFADEYIFFLEKEG